MCQVFLDLFETGVAWEELIVKTLVKWTGMAGLCKTVSKLYKSFVEWYGENDNEKQQLHDFGKYVVAFLEIAILFLKFAPPLLGLKVMAGVGLVIGLLFLINLARMAYEHYRQNQRRAKNSVSPINAATLRVSR
ncbi:hypothetical protein AAVH_22628 [Aphelenchoides avenae]|nr:hypothetical protein AAVH_22628 [Aphelenchus avenae]